jgi:hypothetical protein
MTSFQRLSIRTKLIADFSFLSVAMVGLGIFAIDRIHAVNDISNEIAEHSLPNVREAGALEAHVAIYRASVPRHLLSAAGELARHSSDLRREVGDYIDRVKGA